MKIFDCIIDDGCEVFRTQIACKSKKELLEVYGGNGTFEKIRDVTKEYFTETSVHKLEEDLFMANWGEGERSLIVALLQEHIDKNKR